ncbi:MAG: hypothetical protein KF726_23515 [Anaerolineae bacterium]|nr:hypothetical protein [Anaerolineae bacterium]
MGANAPVLPYVVADIRKIATIGVIPWIHPTVQWIQVEVQSSAGAVMKGYLNLTDPADGSTVLDVSGSCTSGSGNVPIPEVTMPTAPPATAVMPTMYSIFGGLNNVGTGTPTPAPKIAPAVMGSCLLHDGSVLPCGSSSSHSTIDLVPRNIELCTDARDINRLDECDPDLGQIPSGIPIYSPVKGCIFYTAGLNIVIEFSPTNDPYLEGCDRSTLWDEDVRYQISITHLVPAYTTMAWRSIEAGTLIGRLCTNDEWVEYAGSHPCKGPVNLDTDAPPHLAFHLFMAGPDADSVRVAELPNDVRGFLARPNCFFDRWKSTNGSTPMLQTPTPGQPLFAC